ncbi:MAG: transposase [Rectinema sp.]
MEGFFVRYSEAFKLQVVNELESGRLSGISEANRRYGIRGQQTVVNWLRKYGRESQLPRIVRVETPDERDQLKKLKAENDRLKMALADEHLKAALFESWFEVACREFGVKDVEAFKKKLEGRQ